MLGKRANCELQGNGAIELAVPRLCGLIDGHPPRFRLRKVLPVPALSSKEGQGIACTVTRGHGSMIQGDVSRGKIGRQSMLPLSNNGFSFVVCHTAKPALLLL